MTLALVTLCFLVSGACGLMYETVWVKERLAAEGGP